MREDGAELPLARRACSRLHLDQIRPHYLVQSGHRRFVDAVRAGLQLKDHFPQHDVKVDSIQVTDATEALAQDPVLH